MLLANFGFSTRLVVHSSFPAERTCLGRGPSCWAGGHGRLKPEPLRARTTGMDACRIAHRLGPLFPLSLGHSVTIVSITRPAAIFPSAQTTVGNLN